MASRRGVGRRAIIVLVVAAMASLVSLVLAPDASACSCAGFSDSEAYAEADVVFTAALQEVRTPPGDSFSSADPERFIFDVDRVYKGEARATQSVVTPREGASCGLELVGAGPFLVFASAERAFELDMEDGELSSHLCTGTRPLGTGAVPSAFGPGRPPEAGASPVGSPSDSEPRVALVIGGALVAASCAVALLLWRRRARAG